MTDHNRRNLQPGDEWLGGGLDHPPSGLEAQKWVRLYSELVEFAEAVLRRMRDGQKNLPQALWNEVETSDIRPMESLIADYRNRLSRLQRAMISVLPDIR